MKKQLIIMVALTFILALLFGTILADATGSEKKGPEGAYKYHTSILIVEGDTLWGLARTYAGDISLYNAYIEEVKTMNGLKSDEIYAGQNLLIFYYSKELK